MVGDIAGRALDGNYYLILAFAFIPAVYGLVHLGALAVEFPTRIEKLFWRIS